MINFSHMDLTNKIQQDLSACVKALYNLEIESSTILVEHPENPSWGDYASNLALRISKELKQKPMDIAKNISYEMLSRYSNHKPEDTSFQIFQDISVASPGFINFKVSTEWLISLLMKINETGDSYGSSDIGQKKRLSLEHSNVNPNKAAHIGHLRNACIGQFLERAYEFLGYDVNVQYYDNDLGVQVTTSLMGVKRVTEYNPENYPKYDHFAWDVYSKMESMISGNKELEQERQNLMSTLEDPTSSVSVEQERLAHRILLDQLQTFHDLSFDYDVIVRERDIVTLKFWDRAFALMKENPRFYYASEGPSKGCWLVKMTESKSTSSDIEEDKIIVRSNGVPTYTGKDIAYHMWKFGLLGLDFHYDALSNVNQQKTLYITNSKNTSSNITFSNADIVLNVIDGKQTYAMEAVRLALSHLGYVEQASNMKHINYGFVYLSPSAASYLGMDVSDGKEKYEMSGRKGWGIKIDDFISSVENKLISSYGNFENLKLVRNGAIKFEMLKYNTFQDITFDLESALNQKGFTGPYVQYTFARTAALLEKATYDSDDGLSAYIAKNLTELMPQELEVLRYIYRFPEIVLEAAHEYSPNTLCNFLFLLCQKYNAFYAELPILKEEDPARRYLRLIMTRSVKQVLKNGLNLLGIEAPSRM